MEKNVLMSVFIAAIMLFSVAGFALSGARTTGHTATQDQEQHQLPLIVERQLTSQEKAAILGAGRVILESSYSSSCENCELIDQELRDFVNSNPGFVIMESVRLVDGKGYEILRMIGSQGKILDLDPEKISSEIIFDNFCEVAIVQPRECLLKDLKS